MPTLVQALRAHLRTIERPDSVAPKPLSTRDLPQEVSIGEELTTWFQLVDGADADLAWGMQPLSLTDSLKHHEMAGEYPDYWPAGFLPILMDGGGSYVVVNCLSGSPTYGAVYDMSEGVGCTRISDSLRAFIIASTQEAAQGLRKYSGEYSTTIEAREYLDKAGPLFGNSHYFARADMSANVVDWMHGARPEFKRQTTPRAVAGPPASPEIVRWAGIVGLPPPERDDRYTFRLSTAPVEQHYFKKSKLSPQTASIAAEIRHETWTVRLTREDRLFMVTWSSSGNVAVNSEQLKYQRMIKWPALPAIEGFPALVKQLEALLSIKFLPEVDASLPGSAPADLLATPGLREWLKPCASKVGSYIGS